jgi:predicted Zn-dependent protease
MSDTLQALSQGELLALALEATRRLDTGHAVAYLKEACVRPDASPEALFMLGSEYAQLGLMDEAKANMGRALARAPDYAIARFQLGMLHLTSGEVEHARAAWAGLDALPASHPQAYLAAFHRGMLHLMADDFDAAVAALKDGLAQNAENEPLNGDMRRVIDAIEHLPGRTAAATPPEAPTMPGTSPAKVEVPPAPDADVEPSHLFITAYTHRGKPH